MRYAIFVHDPDGDSGDGCIVGPFRSFQAASDKADSIIRAAERRGFYIEPIVVHVPADRGSNAIVSIVMEDGS